ncbi:MAG: hypothetical protein GY947_00035, partial [Rhodobacteraceae bacterium]|nr:hypothetical protein [Paracoccaceae bacterium]
KVTGVEQLRRAIVADLRASNPVMFGPNGVDVEATADNVLASAGIDENSRLTPGTMTKVASIMKNDVDLGNPAPDAVMDLGHVLNFSQKFAQSGKQIAKTHAYLNEMMSNELNHPEYQAANAKLAAIAKDSQGLLAEFKDHVRLSGMKTPQESQDLSNRMMANAADALELADLLPGSVEDVMDNSDFDRHDFFRLPKKQRQMIENRADKGRRLKQALHQQATATHDLALSLTPRANRGIPLRPSMMSDGLLDKPNGLHNAQVPSLREKPVVPHALYSKQSKSQHALRNTFEFFNNEHNAARAQVADRLDAYQQNPSDNNLNLLADALEDASIANDYLVSKYDRASSRYRHEPAKARQIAPHQKWAMGQRRKLQTLKLMVTHANDQRDHAGHLYEIDDKDKPAKALRQRDAKLEMANLPPVIPDPDLDDIQGGLSDDLDVDDIEFDSVSDELHRKFEEFSSVSEEFSIQFDPKENDPLAPPVAQAIIAGSPDQMVASQPGKTPGGTTGAGGEEMDVLGVWANNPGGLNVDDELGDIYNKPANKGGIGQMNAGPGGFDPDTAQMITLLRAQGVLQNMAAQNDVDVQPVLELVGSIIDHKSDDLDPLIAEVDKLISDAPKEQLEALNKFRQDLVEMLPGVGRWYGNV